MKEITTETRELIDKLNTIFPRLKLHEEEIYTEFDFDIEAEFAEPIEHSWCYIIEKLRENNLEIREIK